MGESWVTNGTEFPVAPLAAPCQVLIDCGELLRCGCPVDDEIHDPLGPHGHHVYSPAPPVEDHQRAMAIAMTVTPAEQDHVDACRHVGLGHGAGGKVHPRERHAAFYDDHHKGYVPSADRQPIGVWDYYETAVDGGSDA